MIEPQKKGKTIRTILQKSRQKLKRRKTRRIMRYYLHYTPTLFQSLLVLIDD